MIIPACGCDPDDGVAAMLSRRCRRTTFESLGKPIYSLIFFSSAERRSKPSSTMATVLAESDRIRLILSTTPLDARCTKVLCA